MTKFNKLQNSFSSGELSKKLRGRTDIKEYFQGCEKLENMLTMPLGGITRRPGTQYLQNIGTSTPNIARMLKFVFSKTETYLLLIRVSAGNPFISVLDQDGNGIVGSLPFLPNSQTSTASKLDVHGWRYAQSGDAMFLVHSNGDFPPHILKRTAVDTFTLSTYEFGFYDTAVKRVLAWPFRDLNISSTTMTFDGVDKLTSSVNFFTAGHVGSYFRLIGTAGDALEGLYYVTAYNSATSVDVTELIAPTSDGPTTIWQESAWSGYRGFPSTVVVHQQRLIFGGNDSEPDTIWFSKIGNLFHMMQTRFLQDAEEDATGLNFYGDALATDPFSATISSTEVNRITFLSGFKELICGTLGNEQTIKVSDVDITPQTAYGSSNIQPVQINNNTFFISRDGRSLRDFKFNDTNGSYISRNLSYLNPEIIHHNLDTEVYNAEFREIFYQPTRGILWAITNQDELIGITIDENTQVTAWHRHTFGGTDVKVLGGVSVVRQTSNYEDLVLLIERTVNGSTVTYLEKVGYSFEETALYNASTSEDAKPIFSDSAVLVIGATPFLGTEDGDILTTEDGDSIILE